MFSPFGAATQSSSQPPAFNPFSSKPANAGSPFGFGGANSSSQIEPAKIDNPFARNSDNGGVGTGKPFNPFADQQPAQTNGTTEEKNDFKGWKGANNGLQKPSTGPQTSFGQFKGQGNGFGGKPNAAVSSPAAASIQADNVSAKTNSNDPHAIKVYAQLRKDGIRPPAWPSQPGDPNNKAQMAKFREQYEEYRSKVRASLTRAGLIDDPSKRRTLQDAIDFRGICEDMCPEYEKITRITEFDVPQPERDPATTFAVTSRMVKKLARSAAGQEAPLPMDVLSVPTLRKTLNYLVDDLLQSDGNLPALHGYLWDRTRAIRRDFSFFSTMAAEDIKTQTYVLENIARFHVTSLHLLSQAGKAPEDFVEQQELEQLGKALLTLRDIYDDCAAQGIECENEPEFRAFYLVFHANDPNIIEILQRQWRPSLWRDSDHVRTAVSLVEALHNTQDFHGPLKDAPSLAASSSHLAFFRIVEDPKVSYTMACFAECHFPQLRRSILRDVKRGLSRPKESTQDITAQTLNTFLRFDTVQQAIDFAELHDLGFAPNSNDPNNTNLQQLVIKTKGPLPHHRLQHQFSQSLVEKKRGSHSLPDIIHRTIYEDATAKPSLSAAAEPSLFVQDDSPKPTQNKSPTLTGPFGSMAKSSPFTAAPAEEKAPTTTDAPGKPSPFATANTTASSSSPFASNATSPFSIGGTANKTTMGATATAFGGGDGFQASETTQPKPAFSLGGALGNDKQPASSLSPSSQPTPFKSPFGTAGATAPGGFDASLAPKGTPVTAPAPSLGFQPSLGKTEPPMATSPTPQKALPPITGSPFLATTTAAKPSLSTGTSGSTDTPPPAAPGSAVSLHEKTTPATPQSFAPSKPPSSVIESGGGLGMPCQASTAPAKPQAPKVPPRDLLKDFTEWFVKGDDGLLAEFQQHYLDGLLAPVFVKWEKQAAKAKRLEEERLNNEKADEFRRYTLSVRYFYKWKANAREKRLKFLRRSGRDQLRKFYQTQHAGTRRTSGESTSRPGSPESPTARASHQKALLEGIRQRQASSQYRTPSRQPLDVGKHRDTASAIIGHFNLPQSQVSTPARSRSSSMSRGGSKTRALREELLGGNPPGFGRSLPSVASSERSSPDSVRSSKVSERWRLKAMGIVQLPDGTAVPESLINDRRFNRTKRASSITNVPSRKPSLSGLSSYAGYPSGVRDQYSAALDDAGPSNKRKRISEDEASLLGTEASTRNNAHKRVMSDAESLIQELRSLREEMEEGTMWFKSQNSKLQGEISSRGGTPLDESI